MSVESLYKFVKPPVIPKEIGSDEKWKAVENKIGLSLPNDYKEYISIFGTGGFNKYILPLNPFTENQYLNLLDGLNEQHEAERIRKLNFPDDGISIVDPFELYPAENGLLCCGTTPDFGDFIYWQVIGAPDKWKIILYNLRHGDYEKFDSNFVGFLTNIFSGKQVPQTFPPFLAQNSEDAEEITFG